MINTANKYKTEKNNKAAKLIREQDVLDSQVFQILGLSLKHKLLIAFYINLRKYISFSLLKVY